MKDYVTSLVNGSNMQIFFVNNLTRNFKVLGKCYPGEKELFIENSLKKFPKLCKFVIYHEYNHLLLSKQNNLQPHKQLDKKDKLRLLSMREYWEWKRWFEKHKI